jgi:feruloyl esterase
MRIVYRAIIICVAGIFLLNINGLNQINAKEKSCLNNNQNDKYEIQFNSNSNDNDLVRKIKSMHLKDAIITNIQNIPAGDTVWIDGNKITDLPAFIRVSFTSKPTLESNIRCELWLPKNSWNGRFLGTGNGGGAGNILYAPLIDGLRRGFATANTDMGTSPGVYEIIGSYEKYKDFGYRATHEMTVISKEIIRVFYGKSATYSYFVGVSTGGQQALMEAQRFPNDYNGIIAGLPANNRTHLHASFIWNLIANNQGESNEILSQNKMKFLSEMVIQNCVGQDGGAPADHFISDPRLCHFNLELLPVCSGDLESDSCFTLDEMAVLKKIYEGTVNQKTGERIYTPIPIGGDHLENSFPHLYIFNWVFGKNFDYKKFDFNRDMDKVDAILAPILNANNPDLSAIKARGGKILMYAGTDDQLVPFQDAVNYYERVIQKQGGLEQTQCFFRFYIVPGMGHGRRGKSGLFFEDILSPIMDWVEKDLPPYKLISTTTINGKDSVKLRVERPVFPYPEFPHYKGGDPNSADSYTPTNHPRGNVLIPSQKYLK